MSRKPGTRHTEDLGQLCHVSLAHGTETFEGKNCHANLAHGTQPFLAHDTNTCWGKYCKSGTPQRDVLWQLCDVNLAHGTEMFERKYCHVNLAHATQMFQGSCFVIIWHTAHRCFTEIVSPKPGTRHTDVSGQLCHVSLTHCTQTI